MDGLVVWHTFFFGTFRTIFFAVGGSPEFVYSVIRSMMQWYIRIIHTYVYVYVTCLYLYMVASPRSTYLSFLNGILEYKMHIFFNSIYMYVCTFNIHIPWQPKPNNDWFPFWMIHVHDSLLPRGKVRPLNFLGLCIHIYIRHTLPGKLTWLAIENHLISNRRYIFIHGYFSIVIH